MASNHADEIKQLLEAADLSNVDIGLPHDDIDDEAVFIVSTSGLPSTPFFDKTAIRRPTFQIRVRSSRFADRVESAYARARRAYDACDFKSPSGYLAVQTRTEIMEMPRDDGRTVFAFNVIADIEE